MAVVVCSSATMISDLLCTALESAGHVISARYRSTDEITRLKADCSLVVHISETPSDAVRKIREIRAMSPGSPIIVLCSRENARSLRGQLGLDVDAVIPDDRHMDLVISSLVVVENGYKLYHRSQIHENKATPQPADELHHSRHSNGNKFEVSKLSKREVSILGRLLEGSSNKEIANELGIADTTVKVHLRSIFNKTGVKNRTQAAIWASEHLM